MAYKVIHGKLVKASSSGKLDKRSDSYKYMTAVHGEQPKTIRGPVYRSAADSIAIRHPSEFASLAIPADPKDFPKDKGKYKGACNRSACLRYPATWYNRGSYAFYCASCGRMLNDSNNAQEFCKDEPLCKPIQSEEEAADCYVMPRKYN